MGSYDEGAGGNNRGEHGAGGHMVHAGGHGQQQQGLGQYGDQVRYIDRGLR